MFHQLKSFDKSALRHCAFGVFKKHSWLFSEAIVRGPYQWGTPPSHLDLVFSGPKISPAFNSLLNSISHPYQIHINSIPPPYQIHIKSIWGGRGYPIERVSHWFSSLKNGVHFLFIRKPFNASDQKETRVKSHFLLIYKEETKAPQVLRASFFAHGINHWCVLRYLSWLNTKAISRTAGGLEVEMPRTRLSSTRLIWPVRARVPALHPLSGGRYPIFYVLFAL